MAEALAGIGVAASVLQLADVGLRLTISGAHLIKKYRDAPHIISRTVGEVERLRKILDVLEEPTDDAIKTLLDGVLKDCRAHAVSLQKVLDRLHVEVDDQARRRIKKKLLTTIEEAKIEELRVSIERHISQIVLLTGQGTSRSLVGIKALIESNHGEFKQLFQTTDNRNGFNHAQMLAQLHHHEQNVHRVYDQVRNGFSDLNGVRSMPAVTYQQQEEIREEIRELKELFVQVLNRPNRLSQEYDRLLKMKSTLSQSRHQARKKIALSPYTKARTSTSTPTRIVRKERALQSSSSTSWLFRYTSKGGSVSATCRISTSCTCKTNFCRACRRSTRVSLFLRIKF